QIRLAHADRLGEDGGQVLGAVVDHAIAVVVAPVTALDVARVGQRAGVVAVVAAGPRLPGQEARQRRVVTISVRVRRAHREHALIGPGVAGVDRARIAVVAADLRGGDALSRRAVGDHARASAVLVRRALVR